MSPTSRVVSFVVAAMLVAPPADARSGATGRPRDLAITHVTLVDGTGAPPRADITVIVRDGRIAAVGPAGAVRPPRGARVVDARGKHLIPGLWDMHVHLTKAGENTLPLFVANGVTSVRDMGGDYRLLAKWRREVAEGKRLGPKIKMAGPMLESAENVARMRGERTVEPVDRYRLPVAAPEDAERAVRFVASIGADFVKVRTVESPEVYRAIAAAAKRAGLPLVGHTVAPPEELLAAGQRSVEHPFIPPFDTLTEAEREALFKRFAAAGMALVPTLVTGTESLLVPVDRVVAIVEDREGSLDPRRRYLSGYIIADWREQAQERRGTSVEGLKQLVPSILRDVRETSLAGVRVMPGTDVGVVMIYPGYTLHDELRNLVERVGLSPMEVLVSATRTPAEFFGMADSLGTIEAGKVADLVLLDADPLADISNTRKIRAVVLGGRLLSRADLDRALAEVETRARRER